jgi:hypothetical protein
MGSQICKHADVASIVAAISYVDGPAGMTVMARDRRVATVERNELPRGRRRRREKAHWLAEGEPLCGLVRRRSDAMWVPLIAGHSSAVTCSSCQDRLRVLKDMDRRATAFRMLSMRAA